MAGLRERQVVSVRLVASQINGDALHGPRVLGDKPSRSSCRHGGVCNTCLAHFLRALVKFFLNHIEFILYQK